MREEREKDGEGENTRGEREVIHMKHGRLDGRERERCEECEKRKETVYILKTQ